MAIKAVIFDCFGVLVMPTHASYVHDFPDVTVELEDLRQRSDHGYVSRADFDNELSQLTGLALDKVEAAYWYKNSRNEAVFSWIREMKKEGKYKIGLLSNIGLGWLEDYLSESERHDLFDAEILSGVVHLTKPDPKIFQMMADTLGVDVSECVMIDDIADNIVGAERAGMRGIVYDSTEQTKKELADLEMA